MRLPGVCAFLSCLTFLISAMTRVSSSQPQVPLLNIFIFILYLYIFSSPHWSLPFFCTCGFVFDLFITFSIILSSSELLSSSPPLSTSISSSSCLPPLVSHLLLTLTVLSPSHLGFLSTFLCPLSLTLREVMIHSSFQRLQFVLLMSSIALNRKGFLFSSLPSLM